jgi:hypothetical protein
MSRRVSTAHLCPHHGVVGVEAHLGGEVEGHAQSALPLFQQVLEPFVRLLGIGKAGILPHGPEASPIHRGIDPSRVREFSREPQVPQIVEIFKIRRAIEHIHLEARSCSCRRDGLLGELRFLPGLSFLSDLIRRTHLNPLALGELR